MVSTDSRSTPFLRLEGISKSYDGVQALQRLSVDVDQGELVTFIGPSGCGKTTLLRAIGGFAPQDSGNVILDGENINGMPPESRPTGMVFQNYALFPHMTVNRNIAYGLKNLGLSKAEQRQRLQDAIRQVRLEGFEERAPAQLSGGQQQRVAIARCLVRQPKLLLLDEPLSNLDANLRVMMRDEIRRIKDELGITVLFVTHDQEEALSISDRILVLNQGEQQQYGPPHTVYNEPANEFVADFLGTSNKVRGHLQHGAEGLLFKAEGVSFPVRRLRLPSPSGTEQMLDADEKTHTVLIRPETLSFDPSSSVQAEVVHSVYYGNFARYTLNIGGISLTAEISNRPDTRIYSEGEMVGIRFPEEPVVLPSADPVAV